jgi:hypothetical protein
MSFLTYTSKFKDEISYYIVTQMTLTALQRRHQNADPTNRHPIQNLKYKRRKTFLQLFM